MLCPVTSLKNMLRSVPDSQNDPLFAIFNCDQWVPFTVNMVIQHLKRLLLLLNLQDYKFTFHTFWRLGASWAFDHGFPIECIK